MCLGAMTLVWSAPARPLAAGSPARPAGGIREQISAKDKLRFQEWKDEFLSTDTGVREWDTYAYDQRLVLTITTSTDNRYGAGIGHYEWDNSGHLVAATITLGSRLDEEYPEPVYYPVVNALRQGEFRYSISRSVLAAAKMAHEFGHLSRMIATDATFYRLQSELVPSYNAIIRNNGWNPRDPRLVELARRMGGTPVEIWEDREYWGEANAMVYLQDRFSEDSLRCSLFTRIRHSVDLYAKNYEPRFLEVIRATPNRKLCGW